MAERTDAVTKALLAGPDTVIVVNVDIEESDEGLLYATSSDLKGLFVAAASIDELEAEVPRVIKVLIEHRAGGSRWEVWPASKVSTPDHITHMWAAVPTAHLTGGEGPMKPDIIIARCGHGLVTATCLDFPNFFLICKEANVELVLPDAIERYRRATGDHMPDQWQIAWPSD